MRGRGGVGHARTHQRSGYRSWNVVKHDDSMADGVDRTPKGRLPVVIRQLAAKRLVLVHDENIDPKIYARIDFYSVA